MRIQIRNSTASLFLSLFLLLTLLACTNKLGKEVDWADGYDSLPSQIGVMSERPVVLEQYYEDYIDIIEQTKHQMPTSKWFKHDDEGMFGYELPRGTMTASERYRVKLFSPEERVVEMNRDVRIGLTKWKQATGELEPIMEEVIHVDAVTGETGIYGSQLPKEENSVYIMSVEVLDQNKQVEDTMVSMVYVPAQEINANITMDNGVITINNAGPTFLTTGTSYTIEKKVDTKWKEVPLDLDFEAIGIIINPNSSYEQTITFDMLPAGEYRILKEVSADGMDLTALLAAEFIVK